MKFKFIDPEEEYQKDIDSGLGFDITTAIGITKDDNKKDPNGIYSPKYGDDVSEDYKKYTCECGKYTGRFYEGITCDKCNTKVQKNIMNIKKTGWLSLDSYYLINPIFYYMMSKIIGKKNLENTIKLSKNIDKDGNFTNDDEYQEEINKNPYFSIGLIEFKNKYEEILRYWMDKRKDDSKDELYDFILKNKKYIFIKRFPIYSTVLRPIMMLGSNNIMYSKINKKYTMLVKTILSLNNPSTDISKKMIRVLPNLYQAQVILLNIWDNNINDVGGKSGHVRSNQLGR